MGSSTARTTASRPCASRNARTGAFGAGRRQDDDRLAVGEYKPQPVGVPGEVRREQWYRDHTRAQRTEEGENVVNSLRGENRDAITGAGDRGDARRQGRRGGVKLPVGARDLDAGTVRAVVDERQGRGVTPLRGAARSAKCSLSDMEISTGKSCVISLSGYPRRVMRNPF